MANETIPQQPLAVPVQAIPLSANPQQNILDQTLGDVLQNNPQAQQMITKSMGITHENFQQMLNSAGQNNLMHMKISDLFKNGIIQQAQMAQGQAMQASPAQMQQMMQGFGQGNQIPQQGQLQNPQSSDTVPYALPNNPPKKSFLQKFRDWLTLKNQ